MALVAGLPKIPSTAPPSEDRPSQVDLEAAKQIPVYDGAGREIPFGALWEAKLDEDGKLVDGGFLTMVVFIRHFYCGLCQAYVKALADSITLNCLTISPPRRQLFVVGCGSHTLINQWQQTISCPFPIYADPSQRLHTLLGMTRTLAPGDKPKYLEGHSALGLLTKSLTQGITWGNAFKGGDIQQVGGEFLFMDGLCVWCHRMKTTRDHTEVPDLRNVMGLDPTPRTPNYPSYSSSGGPKPSPSSSTPLN